MTDRAESKLKLLAGLSVAFSLIIFGWPAMVSAQVDSAGGYIVKLDGKADAPRKLKKIGAAKDSIEKIGEHVYSIKIPARGRWRKIFIPFDSEIEDFSPDHRFQAFLTPDDSQIGDQWYLEKIRAKEAWDQKTGRGDIVAVIDTGVRLSHEDLKAKIWTNEKEIAGNGIDDDGNGYVDDRQGYDFVNGDGDPSDDNGHGTRVGGVAAASTGNSKGIAAVSHGAKVMPIKVLNDKGEGVESDLIAGISYARKNGAKIINLSLGGASASGSLLDTIKDAIRDGIVVVAAAGNSGGELAFPARYDEVISVGASNRSDERLHFSNKGEKLDLIAPGLEIMTTSNSSDTAYGSSSGTSLSASIVAGAVSLILDHKPSLSVSQIEQRLKDNAERVSGMGESSRTDEYGSGRIDLLSLVDDRPRLDAKLLEIVGLSDDGRLYLSPDTETKLTVRLKNIGSGAWLSGGSSRILIGTAAPNDRKSAFTKNLTRLAAVKERTQSNQTGEFPITLSTDLQSGEALEKFQLVEENGAYFGTTIEIPISIEGLKGSFIASSLGQNNRIELSPGQILNGWVAMKNDGGAWQKSSAPVRLGTQGPTDRISSVFQSNRLATVNEELVGRNQTAGFEFSFAAPLAPGLYREPVQLLAEGKSWFGTIFELHFSVPPHDSRVVKQSGGTTSAPIKIRQGETVWVFVQFQNTGGAAWQKTGLAPVRLGTARPRDRLSFFIGTTNRGPGLNEAVVEPGQIGAFELLLTASGPVGRYSESFQLLTENSHWFGETATFEIEILP